MFIRNLRNFDWVLLGLVVVLASMSLVTLFSVSSFYFSKQVIWFVLGLLIIIFGSQLNWQWLFTQPWFRYGFYWFSVILLIITYLQPYVIRGTKSWIVIGNLQFEPSELVKIALIIILAGFFFKTLFSGVAR